MEKAIGIYDSGVGGLSVYRQLSRLLPNHNFLYYADTAHMPYGDRSEQEIITFSKQIIDFLVRKGAAIMVVACNTSSAIALPTLSSKVQVPLVGMIQPAVEAAAGCGPIGLMATQATVDSGAYAKEVSRIRPEVALYSVACPKLVPLVEKGIFHGPPVHTALVQYTAPLIAQDVKCIILGCTHYPFLRDELEELVAGSTKILDPALVVAQRAADLAGKLSLTGDRSSHFYTSGSLEAFSQLATKLLGKAPSVSHVDLGGNNEQD
jgi:glutamate racemase